MMPPPLDRLMLDTTARALYAKLAPFLRMHPDRSVRWVRPDTAAQPAISFREFLIHYRLSVVRGPGGST